MVRLAVVANRVRKNTLMYHSLERFLFGLNIPFISSLRDTQLYARAIELGLGVQEVSPSRNRADREQWAPIFRWLDTPVVSESAPVTQLLDRYEQ
jgi:chromosome partitioning protein